MKVEIPTLNDKDTDFDWLFRLCTKIRSDPCNVSFDFEKCHFLAQNAVAFLGGLAQMMRRADCKVEFVWSSLRSEIMTNLQQNGFFLEFGGGIEPWTGNSVRYRQDEVLDKNSLVMYLKQMWLGQDWVHLSEKLTNRIAGRTWEIYENAFEHAGSPIGVFTCGQHYPKKRLLKLTMVDFGCGIPAKVRQHLREEGMTDADSLRWAFKPGNSTYSEDDTKRGIGLGELKTFIDINEGVLEILSNSGCAKIADKKESFAQRHIPFEGTVVNMSFKCDEAFYRLSSEVNSDNLFP